MTNLHSPSRLVYGALKPSPPSLGDFRALESSNTKCICVRLNKLGCKIDILAYMSIIVRYWWCRDKLSTDLELGKDP